MKAEKKVDVLGHTKEVLKVVELVD